MFWNTSKDTFSALNMNYNRNAGMVIYIIENKIYCNRIIKLIHRFSFKL